MSKPVAKDLDEKEALREVIDALRADNGRLAVSPRIVFTHDFFGL
jgi:hypothetical protein